MNLDLPARKPFLLTSVIHSHGWVQLAPFASNDDYESLKYIEHLSSGVVVEVEIHETEIGVRVEVEDGLSPQEQEELGEKVNWMLALDQDFSEFYELVRDEPKLAQAEVKAQGRILRSPTVFEDTLKTILTTNTAWSGTIRMNRSLVEQFGQPLPGDVNQKAFPLPGRLAQADVDILRQETRLGYRAPYVLELAQAVDAGDLDLESYKTSELQTLELRKRLLDIKGVGNYAAANLLMLLGRYDYIPVDSWAMKMVSHEWHQGEPVGESQVQAAFERWGEWKGLAFWLWDWSYPGD